MPPFPSVGIALTQGVEGLGAGLVIHREEFFESLVVVLQPVALPKEDACQGVQW